MLILVPVNSGRFSANMSDYFQSLEGDAMQEQQLATIVETELYNRTFRISVYAFCQPVGGARNFRYK